MNTQTTNNDQYEDEEIDQALLDEITEITMDRFDQPGDWYYGEVVWLTDDEAREQGLLK